jgi:hypothetical protein
MVRRRTEAQKAAIAKAQAARAAKTVARKAATAAMRFAISSNRSASIATQAASIATSLAAGKRIVIRRRTPGSRSTGMSVTATAPRRAGARVLRVASTPKTSSALARIRALRKGLGLIKKRKPAPRREHRRRRRYTMRMQKAVYHSPSQTPLRARRHKHLDKYKRRIFVGPRGGRFAMRPSGTRVYQVQEQGKRYPLYGVYKKTSKGTIKMLKKFIGVFTTKRRLLKK